MGAEVTLFLPELVSGRGTARHSRVVEGQTRNASGHYANGNRVQIPQHLKRRNTQRRDAACIEPGITPAIRPGANSAAMPLTIDLDRQSRIAAKEIENVGAARMLPPKLQTARSRSQYLPQQHLRQRHLSAQLPRALYRSERSRWRLISQHRLSPSTMLRMVPLPETSSGRNRTRP